MWPWEHLALGYLLYSGYSRVQHRQTPAENPVLVLAVATQLPDIVDKPLAWTVGVLPSGTSLAHSVLTFVLLVPLALTLARRSNRRAYGEAFCVGYGSHLLGDILYPLFTEGELGVAVLLWPVHPQRHADPVGFAWRVRDLFGEFVMFLSTTRGHLYFLFELGLLAATVLLWYLDGWPGIHRFHATLTGSRRST